MDTRQCQDKYPGQVDIYNIYNIYTHNRGQCPEGDGTHWLYLAGQGGPDTEVATLVSPEPGHCFMFMFSLAVISNSLDVFSRYLSGVCDRCPALQVTLCRS